MTILDDFTIDGPNGTYLCYALQLGGPSLSAISDSPGEIPGTRRLRAALARKLARQLAKAVSLMHSVGVVHGGTLNARRPKVVLTARLDITPKNILLQLESIDTWSEEALYQRVGHPVRDEVFTSFGHKPDLSAPQYLVEPASFLSVDFEYISEHALLIDFGETFLELSPPPNGVGTPVSYRSPELLLERKASRASDIWALACTIFEIRSGFPLFESFVGSSTEVLKELVRIIGMPPAPFHSLWGKYGVNIANHARLDRSSLQDRIRELGIDDQEASVHDGNFISQSHHTLLEPSGRLVSNEEEIELVDLL